MSTRSNDNGSLPPEARARIRADRYKMVAGFVIAAGGLAAVFMFQEVYVGFAVALIGAGIVPFEKIGSVFKR